MSGGDAETDVISRVAFPESKREIDQLFDRVRSSMFGTASAGVLLDRYRVIRTLGRGGLGVVYLAHDPELDRDVAVKVARVGRVPVAELQERMRREARALARVSHPNVVELFSVERHDDALVLVMEYVEGRTLREYLRERPPVRALVGCFREIARALEAAHATGIVHRDFKPENVMIDGRDRPRVLDFGLASAADVERGEGEVLGTLPYMAPEQLRGQPVDARADQFAFCVALFEALAGRHPFAGKTVAARLHAIAGGAPRRPRGMSRSLYACIVRGLAVDPRHRWPSMAAVEARLADGRAPAWGPALTLAVAVTSTLMAIASTEAPQGEPCTTLADDLDEVWSPAARMGVRGGHAPRRRGGPRQHGRSRGDGHDQRFGRSDRRDRGAAR